MELLKSVWFFGLGMLRRCWIWLPGIFLGPFDFYNTYIRFRLPEQWQGHLNLPSVLFLPAIGLLLFWSAGLTYHHLRRRIPNGPSIRVHIHPDSLIEKVHVSVSFDLLIENVSGPVAEFVGSISVESWSEHFPGIARNPDLQGKLLASRDTADNRVPIIKGQRGAFRLCQSAITNGRQSVEFAIGNPGGFEWRREPGYIHDGQLDSKSILEVTINSEPAHNSIKTYRFLIKPTPPTEFLQLEDITCYRSASKLPILKRFGRDKELQCTSHGAHNPRTNKPGSL